MLKHNCPTAGCEQKFTAVQLRQASKITCPKCKRTFSVSTKSEDAEDVNHLVDVQPPPLPPLVKPVEPPQPPIGGTTPIPAPPVPQVATSKQKDGPPWKLIAIVGSAVLAMLLVASTLWLPLMYSGKSQRPSTAGSSEVDPVVKPARGVTGGIGGNNRAVLVGVKDYNHSRLSPLQFTENDVTELAEVLQQGKFDVTLLTTTEGQKNPNNQPTAKNIRAAIAAALEGAGKKDMILLAFAGHGLHLSVADGGKQREESFFCPTDASPKSESTLTINSQTMLGYTELFRNLDESGAGVKLLLIDACRNRAAGLRGAGVSVLPRTPNGFAAMFSCSEGEFAAELPELGKGHGIFFHFVLEGLRGKARAEDGVTWDDLARYVVKQVSTESIRMVGEGHRQTPHHVLNLRGLSPVLVERPKQEVKVPNSQVPAVKNSREPVGGVLGGGLPSPQPLNPVAKEPVAKEPVAKEPVAKEPVAKEPVAKEPVAKEPVAKEPVAKEPVAKKSSGYTKSDGHEYFTNNIGMKFVRIPRGEFMMGADKDVDPEADDDEKPRRKVKISSYWCGVYEVTQGQYQKVMGTNPSWFDGEDDFPVESVSWEDAKRFIQKLNEMPEESKAGNKYRLITEAEWEYTCRGSVRCEDKYKKFSFGDTLI
jgi:hypothetical protein